MRETQFRAIQTLEKLSAHHKKQTIVVVSHADLIKLVLAHYLGVHMDLFQRITISPASVSVLTLSENGGVRVVRMNDDGPLRIHEKKADGKSKSVQKNEDSAGKHIGENKPSVEDHD